jgi:imidazolonepropionase-like amidohydrolase
MRLALPLLLLPLCLLFALGQKPEPVPASTAIAFVNATIYTGTADKPIEKATLLIRDGKIVAVGADVELPANFQKVDVKGGVIIPGLVDTHSHIGLWPKPNVPANSDGNEMSGPVQSVVRALDSIDPNDPGIRMATAGGITTANIMPGSGNVIGGQTLYVKLRGASVEEMRVFGDSGGAKILGGLKMANGENPKGYGKSKGQAPFTRMKVAALQREQFVKAKEYMEKLKGDKKPDRDLALEPLVEVLEKKRTVHFHCHRADDLMTAIRISEEFGFELVLQHATEGYRIADVLAKKKIPASLTLIDSPGGKAETMGLLEENAAILDKAGVQVCINTDDAITESRFFLRTGSLAMRGGMSEAAALKALTLTPAKILHLDHRIGTLVKGKDADFVVLSGAPFSVYTKVQQTWIDGKKVFDEANANEVGYRDGGFLLAKGIEVPKVISTSKPLEKPDSKFEVKSQETPTPKQTWIFADRIHTGTGKVILGGMIVVENGKILKADALKDAMPKFPDNIKVIQVKDVSPGLIDAFTVAGLSGAWNIPADQDQDETSDPNQSDLRVLDGFNPLEPLLEFLRSNGVTVVHTTPGRANPIAGMSGIFRTEGRTVEASALNKGFVLLVNLGEVPKSKAPQTRMGTAALVRKQLAEAQAYKEKKGTVANNPKHEAWLPALAGKAPVIFAAHRADDIRTALRIAEEFNLKPVIALGTEAWMLADELAKKQVPVIVHPTMQRAGGSMETLHTLLANAAILQKAGVPVLLGTAYEGYVPKIRNLRSETAMAAANGLGHAAAMKAITLDAAKFLGIDKEYGSVEAGKLADLVLYDGDPFEHSTHVQMTIMNGKVVYDRAEYLKLPFERRILPIVNGGVGAGCCLGIW